MAFSVDLVNVSGRDVTLSVDGQHRVVLAGDTVTVTPEAAGDLPQWRPADDVDRRALEANPVCMHARTSGGQLEVFDLGTGLLAQPDNWARAGHEDDTPAHPLEPGDKPSLGEQDDTTTGTENS